MEVDGNGSGQGSGAAALAVLGAGVEPAAANGEELPTEIRTVEPPFEMFRELEGVEAAARVLQTKGNIVVSGRSIGSGAGYGHR